MNCVNAVACCETLNIEDECGNLFQCCSGRGFESRHLHHSCQKIEQVLLHCHAERFFSVIPNAVRNPAWMLRCIQYDKPLHLLYIWHYMRMYDHAQTVMTH